MAGASGPVEIRDVDAAALVALARGGAPREVCGLLVGRARTIVRVVPTPNDAPRPTEYAIPAEAHFAAIRAARAEGLEVIGAYHSHPGSAAEPSPRDAAAAFEDFVFLIVGLAPAAHLRAWTFTAGNFAELALVRR